MTFFFHRIFLSRNFSFHKNISFVFDVCEIMYFAKIYIRSFAYCEVFVLQFWCTGKKIFLQFFFLAMNLNTKFENVSFLKKSKFFSDRTFGFIYSLLGK